MAERLDESVRKEIKDSITSFYESLRAKDAGREFRIEEQIKGINISFERQDGIRKSGKHWHRYIITESINGRVHTDYKTGKFDEAFWFYYFRTNQLKTISLR